MAVGVCINGTKHGVSLLCLLGCHAVTADSARIIELWGGGNKHEEWKGFALMPFVQTSHAELTHGIRLIWKYARDKQIFCTFKEFNVLALNISL